MLCYLSWYHICPGTAIYLWPHFSFSWSLWATQQINTFQAENNKASSLKNAMPGHKRQRCCHHLWPPGSHCATVLARPDHSRCLQKWALRKAGLWCESVERTCTDTLAQTLTQSHPHPRMFLGICSNFGLREFLGQSNAANLQREVCKREHHYKSPFSQTSLIEKTNKQTDATRM